MLTEEASPRENEKHIHSPVRVNLHACRECGSFLVTTYVKTEDGDLVLKELELDLKVKSSRIGLYQPAGDEAQTIARKSTDRRRVREETCW